MYTFFGCRACKHVQPQAEAGMACMQGPTACRGQRGQQTAACRAARGAAAARGDRRARLALRWRELARRALRLAFKRRCWALLGIHLRGIKEAGGTA